MAEGKKQMALGALITGLILFPLLVPNDYYVTVAIFVGIYGILALSLNLLMGFAGQISLGHAAFYGLGAYTSGILTAKWGISPWMAFPLALAIPTTIAFIVGLPTLRLRGYYLAMATLGLGIMTSIVLKEWEGLTGGHSGLMNIPPLSFMGHPIDSDRNYYYLVWGFVGLSFLLAHNILNSRVGRGLRALHGSESAAQAMGVNTAKYKVDIFVFTAGMAALAGFLYAHYTKYLSPDPFGFFFSIELVAMVVIGGMLSLWGGLIGAVLLTVLPEILRTFQDYDVLIFGMMLIATMIFLPGGIVEGLGIMRQRLLEKTPWGERS